MHDHPQTGIHIHTYIHTYIHIYIYIHTYIHIYTYTHTHIHTYNMYNANMQSRKVEQTSQTSQGYGLERYKKRKSNIVILREHDPSKE